MFEPNCEFLATCVFITKYVFVQHNVSYDHQSLVCAITCLLYQFSSSWIKYNAQVRSYDHQGLVCAITCPAIMPSLDGSTRTIWTLSKVHLHQSTSSSQTLEEFYTLIFLPSTSAMNRISSSHSFVETSALSSLRMKSLHFVLFFQAHCDHFNAHERFLQKKLSMKVPCNNCDHHDFCCWKIIKLMCPPLWA